jgi:hypothetical protein
MGVGPLFPQERCHPHRAQQVDLDGRVQRRVEAHGSRGVHDDVGRCECPPVIVAQAQPVDGDIAADNPHAALDLDVEVFTPLRPETVEAVVAEDLPARPVCGRRPAPGPDEQHQFALGDSAQQPFHERCAEEAGGARDRYAFARQGFSDHRDITVFLLARRARAPPSTPFSASAQAAAG